SSRPPSRPLAPYTTLFRSGAAPPNTCQSAKPPATSAMTSTIATPIAALVLRFISRLPPPASTSRPAPSEHAEVTEVWALAVQERSEEHTSELQSHLNLVCR